MDRSDCGSDGEDRESAPKVQLSPGNLSEYFRGGLNEAANRQKVELDEPTREYLVQLLTQFSDRGALFTDNLDDLMDEPIGVQVLKAMQAPPAKRFQMLRQVGDYSLYLTGFFSDSIGRTLNDEKYFIDLGSGAYHSAAKSLVRGGDENPFRRLLSDLSGRFVQFVDVLNDVSERCFNREVDVLRLCDRFQATGSPRVAARLAQMGVAVGACRALAH